MDSGEHKRKEILAMGVTAKPIKVTFAVKPDKIHEFRAQEGSKTLHDIQTKVQKITNITVKNSAYEKNK